MCQTLLINLTGDELGRGGRDQQDSGSQGSQKMSGSARKKSDKRRGKLFLSLIYDISGSLQHPKFTLTYLRYVSNSFGMFVHKREVGVSSFL